MSEEVEEFDKGSWIEKSKQLRELDIFISEHLFNKPVFMWWWVSNHDGCDMIEYFNRQHYLGEEYKEPLYEIKEDDFDWFKLDENREDEKHLFNSENIYNGVHRWNLKKIPEYSRDLNLIRRCEEKLKELGLINDYVNEFIDLVQKIDPKFCFDTDSPSTFYDFFYLLNVDSETKAKAIVETLKRKKNG